MKIKRVSGLTCFSKILANSARTSEAQGFETRKGARDRITLYSNWFRINFMAADEDGRGDLKKEAQLSNKGAGIFVYRLWIFDRRQSIA